MSANALRVAAVAGAVAMLPGVARAVSLPKRTFTIGAVTVTPNGPSANPAVSGPGSAFAFDSAASNLVSDDLNGGLRDVFRADTTGTVSLVSRGLGGASADGPSAAPAIANDGQTIAFASRATNLVEGDTNRRSDIFVRTPESQILRVSVSRFGASPNGDSYQPDISADGRYVAFRSTASNLVAGDLNRHSDVFVRDLVLGRTTLVSAGRFGRSGRGASTAPAISATGRFVSFTSTAADLVARDRNRVADVFVRDLRLRRTDLVSIGSGRLAGPRPAAQQNASVLVAGFSQVSDVSASGRYVAFDSDATSLVPGDRNGATDVFVRDRLRGLTTRMSLNTSGGAGNRDSFFPSMTPDGRYVAFQSFASNLAAGGTPREDIFVRDRALAATSVADVGDSGQRALPLRGPQVLQRPSVSSSALVVGFTSTAANLAPHANNGVADAFLRVMTPPATRLVTAPPAFGRLRTPGLAVTSDDAQASSALCRLDGRRALCPLRLRLAPLAPGRHFVTIRAGGPGLLYDRVGLGVRFTIAAGTR